MKFLRPPQCAGVSALASAALLLVMIAPLPRADAQATIAQPTLKQAPVQMRSAQSDCVREANRRGYAVIDTGNYQQARDGWTVDIKARDRRGRTVVGSCFVETRTRDVSLYGFGWGDDWNGQNKLEFVCASTDSRYRECQLPVNGRASLVKRISDARCIEGQTWGQRRDLVWVDQGCRARFEVLRGGGSGGGLVSCASENQRYRECPIGNGYSARLVREVSNGRCKRDSTWGTRDGVIWVTNGCRAEFERIRGFGGNGSGGSGLPGNITATAQTACLNEARRLGFQVEQQYYAPPRAVPGGYRMELRVGSGGGNARNAKCMYSTGTGRARIDL